MSAGIEIRSSTGWPKTTPERVRAIVWKQVLEDIDAQGHATINRILSADECQVLSSSYQKDNIFRSTVVMQQHGFGRGEYRYFKYPLPEIIASLRTAVYEHLVALANHWSKAIGVGVLYPERHADFIERCREAGQT